MDIGGEQTCLSCGEQQQADDRYCGRCGSAVATARSAALPPSEHRPEAELLLGQPDTEVPGRRLDPLSMVLGAIAVSLFGLTAVGLLRSSRIEVSGISESLLGVLAVDPSEPGLVTIGQGQTTSVFEAFEFRIIGLDEALSIDRETDARLLAASAAGWTLVNLDTGKGRQLEPQGVPVLVSNNYLVVERDDALWSIPLSELGHDSTGLPLFELGLDDSENRSGLRAALSGLDELVVLSHGSDGWRERARLDLSTGDHVGPPDTPPSAFTLPYGGLHEVVGVGTFDVIDGSWTKISDGSPAMAAAGSALVHVCAGPVQCRYEWLDRSGQPLDRPVPEYLIEADRRQSLLVPLDLFGDVIAISGPDEFAVFDMAKERVLALDGLLPDGVSNGITLDEPVWPMTARLGLVAVAVESGLELLDLEDDVRYRVEQDFFGSGPRRYVLVPS